MGYICPICKKEFTRKYNLDRHIEKYHKNGNGNGNGGSESISEKEEIAVIGELLKKAIYMFEEDHDEDEDGDDYEDNDGDEDEEIGSGITSVEDLVDNYNEINECFSSTILDCITTVEKLNKTRFFKSILKSYEKQKADLPEDEAMESALNLRKFALKSFIKKHKSELEKFLFIEVEEDDEEELDEEEEDDETN
jgi:hypothetical protein